MIAHAIGTTLISSIFDHVIVSTDDEEIAEVARRFGASTPFRRPSELANDTIGTVDVVAHGVAWMHQQNWKLETVCCVYATAPFIEVDDLRLGANKAATGVWDYVFAATEFSAPIFRAFEQLPEGGVQMFHPEHFGTRSQDLPVALHDAGQFCFGKPEAWLERRAVFQPQASPIVIPRWRVQDIDTEDDWKRAELLHEILESRATS